MKKLVLAVAFAAASTTAFAGGMDTPITEPEVVQEMVETTTGGSSGSLLIPLILIGLVAASTN